MEDPDRPAPHPRPNQKRRDADQIRPSPKTDRWIEAERALVAAMRSRDTHGVGDELSGDTKMEHLASAWLTELEGERRVSAQTLERYSSLVKVHVIPGLGGLHLREVTPKRVDLFLRAISAEHPTQARRCKTVLTGMFVLAVRSGGMPTSPARDLGALPLPAQKDVRGLTHEDLTEVRAAVRTWRTVPDEDGHLPPGPRPTQLLADVVDVHLGTGLRIGEVLATLWTDVDLRAKRPTLTVTGTLVQLKGEGLTRQDAPKTAAGRRTVYLPAFLVEVLGRRQATCPFNEHGAVFATRTGSLVSPHNVRRQWRAVREGTGLEWVTPHTFRKTVASLVDAEAGITAASQQLGHGGTAVTRKHYVVSKPNVAPDLADILEQMGPELTVYSPLSTPNDGN